MAKYPRWRRTVSAKVCLSDSGRDKSAASLRHGCHAARRVHLPGTGSTAIARAAGFPKQFTSCGTHSGCRDHSRGNQIRAGADKPVASRTTHRRDEIYAQTVAPIVVGDQVVVPSGTFVQGKLDRLARNGTRAEMLLQSASVIFPDGFVANAAGPVKVESEEGTAWRVAGGGNIAGAIAAPLAGLGLGTLIGHQAGGPPVA
ncbi:MAG TPA: hypothetical protein VE083_02220 [Terriglobales bacterium]|nr:hypothetical protein [Terriglobales bacterium]